MDNKQNIQWFPGHMTRTKRQIEASLPLIEAVVEIIDARVPVSSRNPDLDTLVAGKPRIVLMNKADTADEEATRQWVSFFRYQGITAIPVDCRSGKGLNRFLPVVREVLKENIERNIQKGMAGRALRLMVVGIPNVGKSSFINRMTGQNKAKVADKPGVTRGNQWFTIAKGVEMLDTPGVLWPKFEDQIVGERLAFTGAVKDDIMDIESLAMRLIESLREEYPDVLAHRYKTGPLQGVPPYEALELIGRKRGMLAGRGEIDTQRAAVMLLDEFRGGKLGRITLELPQGEES